MKTIFTLILAMLVTTGQCIVFLNTTDATSRTDEEIQESNVDLNVKINELIAAAQKDSLSETIHQGDTTQPVRSEKINSQIRLADLPKQDSTKLLVKPNIPKYVLYLDPSFEALEYNLGILEAIEEANFGIQSIISTKWGAIVGSLWSQGYTINEIRQELQVLVNSQSQLKPNFPFKNKSLGYQALYTFDLNSDTPNPTKWMEAEKSKELSFYLSKWFSRNSISEYKVPLFVLTASMQKPYINLDSNNLILSIEQSFKNINEPLFDSSLPHFGIDLFSAEVNSFLSSNFPDTKILRTRLVLPHNMINSPNKETAAQYWTQINNQKVEISSKDMITINFNAPSNQDLSREEIFTIAKNKFLNRTSNLPKPNLDSIKVKPFLAHEDLVFLGLELNTIAADHRPIIESYFPIASSDPIQYSILLQGIHKLKTHPLYSSISTKLKYLSDQNGYVLVISLDSKVLNKFQVGLAGAYQIGPGIAIESSHYWVSQFLNFFSTDVFYSQVLKQAKLELNSDFGYRLEWGMGVLFQYSYWDFENGLNHNPDLLAYENARIGFSASHRINANYNSHHSIEFVNQKFLTKRGQLNFAEERSKNNPFLKNPWLEFHGIEINNSLNFASISLGADFKTHAYQGLSQMENPLLVQPFFKWQHDWFVRDIWYIEPRFQARSSLKYLELQKFRFQFKEETKGILPRTMDPLADTLLQNKIQVGELSNYLWDSRYFTPQYLAFELPTGFQIGNFRLGTNLFYVLYYQEDPSTLNKIWSGFETLLKYSNPQVEWVAGVEYSKLKVLGSKNVPLSPKWLFRIGLWGF